MYTFRKRWVKYMPYRLKQDISIGENLKKYRAKTGISQEIVAARLQVQGLDISREIVSRMELGNYNIRISVLLALAKMYRTPIQDFFADLERYE